MVERYRLFASHLLFKEEAGDALGHVYRAGELDRGGLRRTVWLRVFDHPALADAELEAGFERARKISEAVQSNNVAGGARCVVDDGVVGLAHDYMASKPLSLVFDRVAAEGFPIPVDNALLIVEKIALALAAALTAEVDGERVVHGFLQPGLVFVTYDGECVVAGFGLGHALLAATGDDDGAAAVHPYIAPEVLGSRTPSRHGDVYSLGAILFQLLTGAPLPADPGQRRQAIEAATMAYDEEAIPDDIRSLLARSLGERPQDRFSSASDFKKELDRLLYGGAYSPTTFNLALFMDRLFRSDSEEDERQRAKEQTLDVTPYLAPPVEPPPEQVLELDDEPVRASRRALYLGLGGAAAVVVVAAIVFVAGRGPQGPPPTPTPTAAEIAAQRQAQEDAMRTLAQSLVQEMMAEKEADIRAELTARQAKIEELQRRLRASEEQAQQGRLDEEARRQREVLEREIAAEEETQREREAVLAAERRRADEAARQQLAAEGGPGPALAADESLAAPERLGPPTVPPGAADSAAAGAAPGVARPAPTAVPASPTPAPETPVPTPTAVPSPAVVRGAFVEPSAVDSLPVVIKDHPVAWPVTALRSRRQGVIIMQATVNADGEVERVRILRADEGSYGIPEAALEAARKYRFKPGFKDGVPITTYATVTVPYRFIIQR
ncbi:MAG TPA: TonB family protein [Chondromyces sp.]|nr:TonB family protein [Chondromyces sp.]